MWIKEKNVQKLYTLFPQLFFRFSLTFFEFSTESTCPITFIILFN
ncbi:hypothetical protein CU026_2050 [Enterococcus faecium]|nr:hypothetical protein HMPREF1379_02446 [Enterococcus faecium R497]EJX61293.1 hypothetical protein HMPREF1376_02111 [Enterococcus faecium R446]EJX66939.1 hypothetical protein HMPREF1374_00844 [Enterococcus faecium P1190]EJX70191.1 hypothetical protein HMPREF1371_02721 [Enterococcus faecium P1137]EJX74758.1 hypothetical protein HMPREF1372_02144 [Enterococcus faecium P1139]EJX78239.1 hypothetical protein HMPREF1370_02280 [Enterococcus faecium P1123]EJX79562.1 hypothetical protein HMPREF1369_01